MVDPIGTGELTTSRIPFFWTSGGETLKAWRILPETDPPRPALIHLKGGFDADAPFNEQRLTALEGFAARLGVEVWSTEYPGGTNSTGTDDVTYTTHLDVLNFLRLVQSNGDVDSGRVAMWGTSRGGAELYKHLRVNPTVTEDLRCAAVTAAVSDWTDKSMWLPSDEKRFNALHPMADWSQQADVDKYMTPRSPIKWVDQIQACPLLALHGAQDARIPPEFPSAMWAALRGRGRARFRSRFVAGEDHNMGDNPRVVRLLDYWLRIWLGI